MIPNMKGARVSLQEFTARLPKTVANDEPRLLHEFFDRQVRLQPDRPAIECNGETLTYGQLDELANRVATFLRARGIVPGALVALHLEKSCSLFGAMIGILKAGAGYVPLDPGFPKGRVLGILEDADIAIVITDRKLGGELASHTAAEVMFLDEDLDLDVGAPQSPAVAVKPGDVCYVIYTSGSTGRPKGVVVEHRNAVNFVQSLWTVYKLTPQDRIYQGFSIAFDASVEEIWGALAIGGTLVVPSSIIARSAIDAAEFITSHKVTYFSTVPSFLSMITADLPTVRFLVLGGEACLPELVNRWATGGRRLMNTYGPTEATVVATAVDCAPNQPVTIGKPLPGYTVHILDSNLHPVEQGESGEIYLGGQSIARGYLNQPDLTAERFIKNPFDSSASAPGRLYRTFDLGSMNEKGDVLYHGRADAQIKIRGFRIELSEIEAVLMEHPSIQAAAVNVVEFGNLKELAAYVVLHRKQDELDRQALVDLLRNRLPEYMVPRYLDVLDELPQMTSGKVDRKLLPPPRTVLGRAKQEVLAPTTEIERTIVEVWEQVFKTSPISIDDDFFLDLRGHSLFAAQAVTELRTRLGTVHLSIPDFYEFRTPRQLAAHLLSKGIGKSDHETDASGPPVTPATPPIRPQLPRFRYACVLLQFLGVMAFYATLFAPIVCMAVIGIKVRDGELDSWQAFNIVTTGALFVWPSWLLLSIAIKWVVIGRYKPGRYPVWGFYYFRWWLVSRFQALSWSEMFVGTPLMSLYYRAMGARIGQRCSINTPHSTAFDLITLGDDTSIGAETHLLGYRIEDGWLILGNVTIGDKCYIGTQCCLGLDTRMHSGSRLDDMSLLMDGAIVEADRGMCGSPAKAADVDIDDLVDRAGPVPRSTGRTFLFGFIHLVLIYAMGYLLILSMLPGLGMVAYAFFKLGLGWAVAAAFAAVPVSLFWYLFLVVAVKRIAIGRIEPGIYRQESKDYLRYWFLAYLLSNTRNIVLPLYATLYLPTLLRLLGAKIGRDVEISTAMSITPDLLDIGDGSFLADGCIVGGTRIHLGLVELSPNKIDKRSFIGNSAMVPVGIDISDNCLIGVMSTPPHGVRLTEDGTRWLGSPGFELPHTQETSQFSDRETYHPSAGLVALRASIELLRLMLPDMVLIGSLSLFCAITAVAYYLLPLWTLALIAPLASFALSFVVVGVVAIFKIVLIGKFEPVIKPLWCGYVWLNDLVNALYETAAAAAMAPLMGTPFVSVCLRMMGCKVGRWAFLETTLFSEFDLVSIGDQAALNLGATVQTHLFEDRVMKSDYLKIGDECSVGNMAVVLYDTEMKRGASLGPLSVLMKGEVLPPYSRWAGIPTRPVVQPTAAVAVEPPPQPVAIARRVHPFHPRKRMSPRRMVRDRVDWFVLHAADAGHETGRRAFG